MMAEEFEIEGLRQQVIDLQEELSKKETEMNRLSKKAESRKERIDFLSTNMGKMQLFIDWQQQQLLEMNYTLQKDLYGTKDNY